jgi:hypothetical protein
MESVRTWRRIDFDSQLLENSSHSEGICNVLEEGIIVVAE